MATTSGATYDLRTISLGAGVQSSALYLMALEGMITPMPDVAIFADTQQEPPWVYESVYRLWKTGGHRIPIHIATGGDLGDHVVRRTTGGGRRFASVPFWTTGEGGDGKAVPGRRQCTREMKIDVVKKAVRELLGLKKGERAGSLRVEEWIGISLDEASRAKPSRTPWITTRWPLLMDVPMRRYQIKAWLDARGWPEIKKSSCIFCPYRQDVEYARWRDEEPALFAEAVAWDELIRDSGSGGRRNAQYVSRSLRPLRLLPTLAELAGEPSAQINLFENECEGMCGV